MPSKMFEQCSLNLRKSLRPPENGVYLKKSYSSNPLSKPVPIPPSPQTLLLLPTRQSLPIFALFRLFLR